jgi:hypothetical protein
LVANHQRIECPPEMVDYLIRKHYAACSRPMRRCHARDLLEQIQHYCEYNEHQPTVNEQHLDYAVRNYFTATQGDQTDRTVPEMANECVIDRSQTVPRTR